MFECRPPWAAAMALHSVRRTHLRSGWSMGEGFRPWCQRGRTHSGALPNATESHWVSRADIQNREIHAEGGPPTCERCCLAWLRAEEREN